jgi:hypothetical protein
MDRPAITTSTTSGTDPNMCVVHVKDTRQWAVDNDRVGGDEGLGEAPVDPEVVPGLVELEVVVPRLSPASR